jgi:DNA-binding NarL/FixJ family response regulator
MTAAPSRTSAIAVAPATAATSLVLIEDNRLLREGIAAIARTQPDFQLVVASDNVEVTLRKLKRVPADVILLDFGLANHDSLALTTQLCTEAPNSRVIIMGLLPSQDDVADFVRAGASGFLMKDASEEDFFHTIRAVARGEQVLPPALTRSLFEQIAQRSTRKSKAHVLESVRLTSREREIVDLLGEGLSNKEIAQRLSVAVHTVKSHVHHVLEKLALRSRLEVVAFTNAAERGRTGVS